MQAGGKTFTLDRFVPYRLLSAASRASRELGRQYSRDYNVDVPQWRILLHLNTEGGISVRDIEDRVDMERSKVSRAVTRLERAGLLRKTRNEVDRRLVVLELTSEGRSLAIELEAVACAYQARIADRLGPLLDRLNEALDVLLEEKH